MKITGEPKKIAAPVEGKHSNEGGVQFTDSTNAEPKGDSLMTSSTAMPSKAAASRTTSAPRGKGAHIAQRSGSDPGSSNDPAVADGGELDDDDESSENGVVLHKSKDYRFGAVYWRHGFSLPENGRIKISGQTLSFKGIIGTKLYFDLGKIDVVKAPRMGGLVHDAFTVTSMDNSNASDAGGKFLFSTVLRDRKKVLDKIQEAMANVKLRKEEEEFDAISGRGGARDAKKKKFRMPPDATLQKMNIIGEKKLKGVSVKDYYEVAWSEGHNCEKNPVYGPFLEKQKKNNVTVGPWETGTEKFEGGWCCETYTEERIVTFNFMKQTIGQTLVEVKHTQRCRRLGDDQCIVQITMEMKGFPYADCFVVEVRHVASRVGDNDLSIQIGMFVKFLKSCMFENKIKTNSGAETTKAQLALLEMIIDGCAPYIKEAVDDNADESEEDEEEIQQKDGALTAGSPKTMARGPISLPDPIFKAIRFVMMACVAFFRACLWPYIQPELFDPIPPHSIEEALQSTRARMKLLKEISLKSVSERRRKDISREMLLIEKSLSRIEKMSSN